MRDRDEDNDRGSRRGREDDRGSRRGGFVYKERSADSNRKRAENTGRDFESITKDGVKMFKPHDGDNSIRILPPTFEGADHYGLDIHVHYGIGPDKSTFLCLNKMLKKPCPVCEGRNDAQRDGDEDLAKELAPKQRVVMYLIDRDNEKEGVQCWSAPWTVDRDIALVAVDRKTKEVLPLDHPRDGFDVSFSKTGKDKNTKYGGVQLDRNSSDLGRRGDEWLDFITERPLDQILNYSSYEDMAKAFNGGGSGGGARRRDNDDDDRDSRRGRDDDRDYSRSSRSKEKEPELLWDDIHSMKSRELEDLAEEHGVKAARYNDDEELADAICEKLDIDKPKPRRSPGRDNDDDDRDSRRGRDRDEDDAPEPSRRRSLDDDEPPRTRRSADEDADTDDNVRRMRRRSE